MYLIYKGVHITLVPLKNLTSSNAKTIKYFRILENKIVSLENKQHYYLIIFAILGRIIIEFDTL